MSAQPPRPLSPRQQEVADLVADGLTDKRIAARLGIAYPTVRGYVDAIAHRLGLDQQRNTRVLIAMWVVARGVISKGCHDDLTNATRSPSPYADPDA